MKSLKKAAKTLTQCKQFITIKKIRKMTDLNKYFKRHLQGRSILNESSIELNLFEKRMIKHILTAKRLGYNIPVITPVSDRISLDFIGWDNEKYNDVLIVKFNKHQLFK